MELFQVFKSSLIDESIQIRNTPLSNIIHAYSYHFFINENCDPKYFSKIGVLSNIIYISEYVENDDKYQFDSDFFIICLEKTLIFFQQTEIKQFCHFFTKNQNATIYFQSEKIRRKIEQSLDLRLKNPKEKFFSEEELKSFTREFSLHISNIESTAKKKIINIFSIVIKSISSYLLTKAYDKLIKYDRVAHYQDYFSDKHEEKPINKNEYIILRDIGKSVNSVCLIYHIEFEQLFALKIFTGENMQELYDREHLNYQRIRHPFFPKFIGKAQYYSYKAIVIEYIHGKSIDKIEEMNLCKESKIKIIFQLMIGIVYLHQNGLIYRDLRPDNIFIINEKNSISIIDFDRVIDENIEYKYTKDFQESEFIAPELLKGNPFSNKVDIYSIGKIIEKVFAKEITENNEFKLLKEMVTKCTNENDKERPNISYLINYFYKYFVKKYTEIDMNKSIDYLTLVANQNSIEAQNRLGVIYLEGKFIPQDINKSIYYLTLAATHNHIGAQFNLGQIYYKGKFVPQDINKAIYYYSLAANQNLIEAQYNLGVMYYDGKVIPRNINKSIYYFSLAAKQNHIASQYILGVIYYEEKYIPRDINKSIYYFTLAANQNNIEAQFNLGVIYYNGKFIKKDINKSLYYFTLAANKNNIVAQFNLGVIYYEGKIVSQDINKSIYYFKLAANQSHIEAHFYLGLIYYEGKFVSQDINKSIYYFTIAANQNNIEAQFYLGYIYYKGEFITRDINKTIYYFTLAANQNHIEAQFNLGYIYYKEEFITRDINKTIYYFTLAANQNNIEAQHGLGLIYYKGKFIARDINKSIYYYTLAANQNHVISQFELGLIYYNGEFITRDINKSIYYFTLAANQNNIEALYNLGLIYLNKAYGHQDINKAIHYFSLASNHNLNNAQFKLGLIYEKGEYIPKNINKSLQYYLSAAYNNHPYGLLAIGFFYLKGYYLPKNIKKAISYLTLAVDNHCIEANYYLGCIYFEGIGVDRKIDKAIKYFKEGSLFNSNYCKNNLGIIYKNIKKNEVAIEYFEEAIHQKNDSVALYNLGHMYLYGEFIKSDIDKSIELLIKSANNEFYQSQILLSLVITQQLSKSISIENISIELEKHGNRSSELNYIVFNNINRYYMKEYYQKLFSMYKKTEYFYDYKLNAVNYYEYIESEAEKSTEKIKENSHIIDLTQDFYDGFGLKIDEKLW